MFTELTERVSSEVLVHQPAFEPFLYRKPDEDSELYKEKLLMLGTEEDTETLEASMKTCANMFAQEGMECGEEETQTHDPECSQVAHVTPQCTPVVSAVG